ncbi:PspC domain-containing protein [Oceanobacillus sp. CAU 1775]
MILKKIRKSSTNRSLYGVCGGIAEYFDLSPFLIRLLFIFTPLPISLLVYIILANILEDSPPSI